MKLFTLISLSFCFSAFAQQPDSLGFTNKAEAKNQIVNGTKTGKWIEYRYTTTDLGDITTDTNAPYYSLSIYKGGNPYGMVRVYYASGKLFIEIPYDTNGNENGIERQYYESGKLMYERPYVNNNRNGTLRRYYESGKLEMENQFTDGEMNGTLKRYYEDGKLKSITTYKMGHEKKTKKYDKNGNEIK